jgi:hypothetical protein
MAVTQQAIIDGIYAVLIGTTSAGSPYALTNGAIYDTFAPPDPTPPFIVFSVVVDEVQPYFTIDDVQLDFQVDVYGQIGSSIGGPKATRTIGDAVYALLHRLTGVSISGYSGCSILCQSRTPGLETEFAAGGSTQQDVYRDSRVYRLFGTGS